MGSNVILSALVEGHCLRGFKPLCGASGLSGLYRVLAILVELPGGRSPLTRLLEAYVIDASKPHHPRAAIQLEPVNPRLSKLAGLRIQRDVKVKARAVAKEAWAGGFDFEG
jgi:hypothetical protein